MKDFFLNKKCDFVVNSYHLNLYKNGVLFFSLININGLIDKNTKKNIKNEKTYNI